MKRVTISLIIPTHLPLKRTENLINSCISQLDEVDEMIVVVDKPEFFQEYKGGYGDKIKLINNGENIGAVASRNRGIDSASKDIILFLDSDSIVPENLVSSHRESHLSSDAEIVVAGKTKFAESSYWYDSMVRNCDFFLNGYYLRMLMDDGSLMFAPSANISAPTSLYRELMFNESFPKNGGGEDNLWCLTARETHKIYDKAASIQQSVWSGFFNGVVKRLMRWGGSEALVIDNLLKSGLDKYVKGDQSQTAEFLFNFSSGSNFFSSVAPRIHRLGYVLGCLRMRKYKLLNKYINHSGI